MIRKLILSLVLVTQSYALEFTSSWNQSLTKEVVMSCSQDDYQCREVCESETSCTFKEKTCTNCIGTNVYITNIFREMGRIYVNTLTSVSSDSLVELLSSGNFVTITSKSIYNQVDRFNSLGLRNRFKSLCENGAQYPVVFFDMNSKNDKIDEVLYVACDNEFFEMTATPDIYTNKMYFQ